MVRWAHEILDQHLLLAAEAAADARLDHADAAHRQPDQRRDHAAHVEGHLGAGADDQAVVFVPPGERDVGLDVGLLHLLDAVFAFVDKGGVGQGRVHVAVVHEEVDGHVVLGVVDAFGVRLVVDDRRARLHGRLRVEDGRQHLILDLDQLQRLLHQILGLGGHNRPPGRPRGAPCCPG